MVNTGSMPVAGRWWRRGLRTLIIGAYLLLLGLACTKLPTAPPRVVDFEFEFQDREGTPIADALVVLDSTAPRTPLGYSGIVTDKAGRARFRLPEGRYEARIYPPDFSPYAYRTVLPEIIVSAATGHFLYRLDGAYISGEIRGPDGVPLSAGLVRLNGIPTGGDRFIYFAYALQGAAFRVLVPRGVYFVQALGGVDPFPYPTVTLPSIPIANDTTMIFQLEGSRIEGSVTGRGGVPVPRAWLFASGAEIGVHARTNAAGDYFVYLPDGSYRWTITPDDSSKFILPRNFASAPVSGPATMNFSLDGTHWAGTLLTEGAGAPQAGKYVVAIPWLYPNRTATSRTDDTGYFHLLLERGLEYDLYLREDPVYGTWAVIRAGTAEADSMFTLTWPAANPNGARAIATPR